MRSVFLISGLLFFMGVPGNVHAMDNAEKIGSDTVAENGMKTVASETVVPETIIAKADDGEKGQESPFTNEEITLALKEVLKIGTQNAVAILAVKNGFYQNQDVRIGLPRAMDRVEKALARLDNTVPIETLVLRMNRTAEKATPRVAGYFLLAIEQVAMKEGKVILDEGNHAATEYLKKRMTFGLSKVVRPIVKKEMIRAGMYNAYDDLIDQYRRIPFEPNVRSIKIEDYMVEKIMDALFFYIAREEQLIRMNPDKRTTEALKKIFP